MNDEEREVILAEIDRLERAWTEAQERYGITGSRSTGKTMTRYRILRNALESALTSGDQAKRITQARQTIVRMAQAGRIPADVANLLTRILEG